MTHHPGAPTTTPEGAPVRTFDGGTGARPNDVRRGCGVGSKDRRRGVASPCRVGRARAAAAEAGEPDEVVARVRVHSCSSWHAQLVEGFRAHRQAWEEAREAAALGYVEEERAFAVERPAPTFRGWLESRSA